MGDSLERRYLRHVGHYPSGTQPMFMQGELLALASCSDPKDTSPLNEIPRPSDEDRSTAGTFTLSLSLSLSFGARWTVRWVLCSLDCPKTRRASPLGPRGRRSRIQKPYYPYYVPYLLPFTSTRRSINSICPSRPCRHSLHALDSVHR